MYLWRFKSDVVEHVGPSWCYPLSPIQFAYHNTHPSIALTSTTATTVSQLPRLATMAADASQDVPMDMSPPAPPTDEPMYGGYSRFEIELEVQAALSPLRLQSPYLES